MVCAQQVRFTPPRSVDSILISGGYDRSAVPYCAQKLLRVVVSVVPVTDTVCGVFFLPTDKSTSVSHIYRSSPHTSSWYYYIAIVKRACVCSLIDVI